MTATVLIPDRLGPPASIEEAIFGPDVTIVTPLASNAIEISDEQWRAATAIILWHDVNLTAEEIAKLDSCRVIVRCGAGFDNVDLRAAGERGIPVCNVPDYGTNDVADHTLALLLCLWRAIPALGEAARRSSAGWSWDAGGMLRRLTGSTLGIIGLGRIGTAVALRARSFGMRVVCYDPYLPDGYDKSLGVARFFSLEQMLGELDAVSFHAPLTAETSGMGNEAFFARLKPRAVVINTARGGIIQLGALHDALASGLVRSAGLDVLEREPPDERHRLIRAWRERAPWLDGRLIITPHTAFFCAEALEEMRQKAAETAKAGLEGRPLRNVVNRLWLRGHV